MIQKLVSGWDPVRRRRRIPRGNILVPLVIRTMGPFICSLYHARAHPKLVDTENDYAFNIIHTVIH